MKILLFIKSNYNIWTILLSFYTFDGKSKIQKSRGIRALETKELQTHISNVCGDGPCSVKITIGETLQSFNNVVNIFSNNGFNIETFVDDHLCVLSRDKEGINEAVKVKGNTVELKALRETMMELAEDLAEHCKGFEC